MRKHSRHPWILFAAAAVMLAVCLLYLSAFASDASIEQSAGAGRTPKIHPDFADAVIPPNIAPLNFRIEEDGMRYLVHIRSDKGTPVEIAGRSANIDFPISRWRRLLAANRGGRLDFEVFVQSVPDAPPGKDARPRWRRFDTFSVAIADEEIDDFLVYRRIHPVHAAWRQMGIYQRDLRSFNESAVLTGEYFGSGCLNCHTFRNNQTDTMLISTRSAEYANSAIIVNAEGIHKVGATFGYASWHPTGKILAYSANKVVLFLHSAGDEVRDVIDLDSLLAYYDVGSQKVRTSPQLAQKDRLETYPAWSPDGRFLYFCSAPLTWSDRTTLPDEYKEVRYDLVRVAYDVDRDAWGEAETILSARDTGRSILLPRISPDGRWLLFCMCEYGCFPVYQQSSDLYLMDLDTAGQTGRFEYRRLEINSDASESWHSWSSNSRWIAFSSKRGSGAFTRTYLSYVDPNGTAHKPLLLPQNDPTHYDSCLWTYSVPEFVAGPVRTTKEKLGRVARSSRRITVEMPVTTATPRADRSPPSGQPYLSTRE